MHPVLLRFGLAGREVVLGSYATFYALAWVVGPLVGAWVASRRGLSFGRVLAVFYAALAAGVVGARALDLFVAWRFYAEDPSRILAPTFQGYSLYGGLAIACVVAIALARAFRLPVWRMADSAVPGIAAGIVLMRAGCFLRGCCFGLPTHLPWGVTYPVGSLAWAWQMTEGTTGGLGLMGVVRPVHPTQLYEMAGAVLLAVLALALMRRRAPDGVAFLAFAIGFTLVRLGNGFLRARVSVITAPGWFYPAVYLAICAVLTWLLVGRLRAGRDDVRVAPPPLPD